MAIKNKYTEDSIESISPREFTRLRPGVFAGSTEYSTQLVREIFSNALDEHTSGRCNKITVEIDTTQNIYTICDDGQGFPINVMRDDGETVLQAAFDVMNTSGKYKNGTGESCYSGSIGTNGMGAKLTNFLSLYLNVVSYNGKQFERLHFEDGIFKSREVCNCKQPSGTIVTWKPDPQFFQNPEANLTELKRLFEDLVSLCPGLIIHLLVDNTEIVYKSENGIQDLINNKVKGKELIPNRFFAHKVVGESLFDMCLTYTSDYYDSMIAYVNYGLTESGVHISTIKAGITRQINRYATENGLLKKNDDPLIQSELSEGLVIVCNLKTSVVKYDSQTKVRVVDLDKTLINQVINNEFYVWLNNNPKIVKQIVDKALLARKAKEAAQNAKDRIRNATVKTKKFINLPTKLVDAYSKNRKECFLIITEGDSACNGLIAKRDGKTQAIFPIRGKILSCRKATKDKVYANQEIANIVKALGLDIDKVTGKLIYDEKKLRYGQIMLASDGDADGYSIRMLLINMFWWLCPELLKNGHICVALPPLFRITTKKNEYIYLKDEKELEQYKKKHAKESFLINRNKGLGEQDPEELAYCLLRPETRNVKTLKVTNEAEVESLLETFMGNAVEPRRGYLLDHISEVEVDVE